MTLSLQSIIFIFPDHCTVWKIFFATRFCQLMTVENVCSTFFSSQVIKLDISELVVCYNYY